MKDPGIVKKYAAALAGAVKDQREFDAVGAEIRAFLDLFLSREDLRRVEEGLKEPRAAAEAIRSAAETEALKEKSRLVREVQAEGRAEVEKAKQELLREMEALKKELDARTAEIAETIEKRILGE